MADGASRIELLDKRNYDVWQLRMKSILVKHDRWGYVSGDIPYPTGSNATEQAITKWRTGDEKAKADIILSIGNAELKTITKCNTSKEIWEKLRSIHASKGPVRKIEWMTEVTSFKIDEEDDFRERLDNFTNAVEQLEGMNIVIPNDMLVVLILNGLPPSFENFRCAIRSNDELPTVEALIGKILDESRSRKSTGPTEDNNVLYAGGRYGRNPPRGKSKPKSKKNKPCFICGAIGHWAKDCPQRRQNFATKAESPSETHYVVNQPEEVNNVSSRMRWCLDSGCTTHMCASEEFLTDVQECAMTLNMANAASTMARAKGLAHIKASTEKGKVDLNLSNTLLVKDLRTNLISVSKITRNDREILFRKDDAIVRDLNGDVKLIADRIGDLYYLREQVEQVKEVKKVTERARTSDFDLWHARLGHLHTDAVVNLSRGQASGIKPLNKETTPCDVCLRGKLTAKPFTPREEKSRELLEIIHSDLCQPSGTKSEGGNRYFVTFIDDYSGWCELYLLKSKDGVLEAFKTYKNYVEKQTGRKIKALQSDNGREYCNKQFDEYLQREGIKRRLTAPYTPQQNGVAERMNRTIVDMARCLLIQAGFPTMYWGAAITTANYLRNRCPSRSHGGVTPHELWFGKKPGLKHLRVFGAKVFVLRKETGRQKLDERSVEGRLVGYCDTAKAYRVRKNDDGKVVITRDVQIVEDNVMGSHGTQRLDVEYTHPQEETPEPGRAIQNRKSCAEHEKEPLPERARGRPRKQKSGKPGRPRKVYRYVSASSITSSRASSRENISQDEEVPPGDDDEELENDVFVPDDGKEVQREKRPLETSLFQEDKRPRNDKGSNDSEKTPGENEDNIDEGEEFMDVNFIEEQALTADVELEEALRGAETQEWRNAIADEVRSHLKHGTWELIDRPEQGRAIGSKLILKNKVNAEGKIERRKARIVARGFSQRPGFDFNETAAPVARLETIRLLAALSTAMGARIQQMDVETAYLHGEIDEELYMEVPAMLKEALEDIVRQERRDSPILGDAANMLRSIKEGQKVCKLRKAIYGLKQSGRKWYERLRAALKKLGLEPTISDPCLFKYSGEGTLLLVAVYVDDILAVSNNDELIQNFKRGLKKEFQIKDLGEAKYCLGIEFRQEGGRTSLSQKRYVEELLERFQMTHCNPQHTPASPTSKLRAGTDPSKPTKNPQYRELIGSLMYLSVATRPDIAHSVSVLSQFNEDPKEEHWGAAKRVLRYLKGTSGRALVYDRSDGKIVGYADADWGNDPADSRSYTGYVFTFAGAAISRKSKKQRTVALSTTEAKYKALTEATKESMYLRGLIGELGAPQLSEGLIYCDNQGAVQLTTATGFHDRTKHVRIQFNFVKEAVNNKEIQLQHMPSERMIADILTKSLARERHNMITEAMGIRAIE